MRLVTFQSVICSIAAGSLGSLPPPRSHRFRRTQRIRSTAVPCTLTSPGSSSRTLSSSTESFLLQTRPTPKCRATSREVPLPIATPARRVHQSASIPARYVPPSAFLTPSTGFSSPHLASLFHPAATSGIHFSGVFLAAKPLAPRRCAVPSCRSAPLVYQRVSPLAPTPGASPTRS